MVQQKVLGLKLWIIHSKIFFTPVTAVLSFFVFNAAIAQVSENPALKILIQSKELSNAHVGIYVYDDSTKKEIAAYQADKYFIPASNTKLFSLYAGMKYLGDSLIGIRYVEYDTAVVIFPYGDPSLLHPDFQSQPVIDLLKKIHKSIYIVDEGWEETPWGPGWEWNDILKDYSVERSQLPVYGNFIRWSQQNTGIRSNPAFAETATLISSPEVSWKVRLSPDSLPRTFLVTRLLDSNLFLIRIGNEKEISQDVPFITNNLNSAVELLRDTLGLPVYIKKADNKNSKGWRTTLYPMLQTIYSRPADSVFIPMMYRSDNFFAEQTLLMASMKKTFFPQLMKESAIIDTLLNGPLSDLPQKPSWVDGSGLSRNNLFSPRDFVTLLIKFKNEFGMDRMKRILPTGRTGTLKNYYRSDSGYVYAKTGSFSSSVCISGYIYTLKNHLLEFSILVNNNNGGGAAIRREVESYVETLKKYN